MRTMKDHITEDGYVDYYECSECGWVHAFPRFLRESDVWLTNEQMAKTEFDRHFCNKHPRKPENRAAHIK